MKTLTNRINLIGYLLTLLLFVGGNSYGYDAGTCSKFIIGEPDELKAEKLVEKKKNLNYTFSLEKGDDIEIKNNFGDVKFKYWDKNEVQFDINIISNATTDQKATAFMDAIKVEASKTGVKVKVETSLNCHKVQYKDNVPSGLGKEESNFLKVNYTVHLPKGFPLKLENAYGDIYMPDYASSLTLKQEHGILYASHLSNPANDININFGKAYIKTLEGGVLNAHKMTMVIDNAKDVQLNNKFGQVKLNNAENIDFEGRYTSGYVGNMKQSCKFKIDYSKDFQIGPVNGNVKDFELVTEYADVEFPLCRKSKFNMTVETNNTDMVVAHEQAAKALDCQRKKDIQKTVAIGTASNDPNKIVILANHGKVSIK